MTHKTYVVPVDVVVVPVAVPVVVRSSRRHRPYRRCPVDILVVIRRPH